MKPDAQSNAMNSWLQLASSQSWCGRGCRLFEAADSELGSKDKWGLCLVLERSQKKLEKQTVSPQTEVEDIHLNWAFTFMPEGHLNQPPRCKYYLVLEGYCPQMHASQTLPLKRVNQNLCLSFQCYVVAEKCQTQILSLILFHRLDPLGKTRSSIWLCIPSSVHCTVA